MRALRIFLIIAVILGGLFTIADRFAVGFAEDKAAEKIKTTEGLSRAPDVSIKGFPFLTQVVGGQLDDIEIGIKNYEATTGSTASGTDKIRIDDLNAEMHGVVLSGDYSSATADSATGTATIAYSELLKTAKSEPARVSPALTARVVGLSDGGDGKIKVDVEATVLGAKVPRPVSVLSTVTVEDGTVKVHADSLPKVGVELSGTEIRSIADFQQKIDELPGGIKVDKIEAAKDGVEITMKGSNVKLVG